MHRSCGHPIIVEAWNVKSYTLVFLRIVSCQVVGMIVSVREWLVVQTLRMLTLWVWRLGVGPFVQHILTLEIHHGGRSPGRLQSCRGDAIRGGIVESGRLKRDQGFVGGSVSK